MSSNYCLGDIIKLHLDYSTSEIAIYKLLINLEQVEVINEQYFNSTNKDIQAEHSKVICSKHFFTSQAVIENVEIQLPYDAVPNLNIDLFTTHWQLSFIFITGTKLKPSYDFTNQTLTQAQIQAELNPTHKTEDLIWNLPLQVGLNKINQSNIQSQSYERTFKINPT